MKKLFYILICLLATPLLLQAQKTGEVVRNIKKGTENAMTKAGKKAPKQESFVKERKNATKWESVTVAPKASGEAPASSGRSGSTPHNAMADLAKSGRQPTQPSPDLFKPSGKKVEVPLSFEEQRRQKKLTAKEQEALEVSKQLEKAKEINIAATAESANLAFGTEIGKSVLFAPVEAEGKTGGFSVTVINTEYQGKKEVFGVIASHVLPESYYTLRSSLQRKFHVHVINADGSLSVFSAEVVQISPKSMLDISLVKLSPEVEKKITPLELSEFPAEENEELFSAGYGAGVLQKETRTVQKKSFLSVRTDQNLTGDRQGFCGSPLVDSNGKLKAIHTGTKEFKGDTPDVSYGTHVEFVRLLIDAYHNQGNALYDLEIANQTLAQLNVDEYISAIYLYDAQGKRIIQKNIEDKFSESWLDRTLQENPHAAYLQLTTRKALWEMDKDGDSILKEDRSRSDKTKQQHWYNLQTRQIEPTRPSIIKM